MIFHFGAFFFSLIFFFFLSWVSEMPTVPSWSWYLSTILPLIALSVFAGKRLTGRYLAGYMPSLVSYSVALLLSLIDLPFEERVFIILGSGIYYLSLLVLYRLHTLPEDQTARAMLNLSALASLFFIFAGAYGLYLNYQVPLWLLMLVFFAATAIVSFQTLRGINRKYRELSLLASLIIGMIFGELIWLLHFWPFGYLTTGVVILLLFYWLWKVVFDSLKGNFSQKAFLIESSVLFLLIVLLLFSSSWRMLV